MSMPVTSLRTPVLATAVACAGEMRAEPASRGAPRPDAPIPDAQPHPETHLTLRGTHGGVFDWPALGLVGAAHVGLVFALLSMEPPPRASDPPQPLMVSLVTPPSPLQPARAEPRPEPLPPRPRAEPRPEPLPPRPRAEPLPVSSTPEAAPSPALVAPPEPVILPAPAPAPAPVKPAPATVALAPPAPAAPAVEVVAPRFDADYLHNPAPAYPALSRRLREEGRVVLRVKVGADGLPQDIQLHTGSGSERLDQAALTTVWRWKFVPARQGGEAIAAHVLVPIVFTLKD